MALTTAVSGGAGAPAPLLLLLHGYGSNEHDLPGLAAEVNGFGWLSVRAPLALGGGAFAWTHLALEDDGRVLPPDGAAVAEATAELLEFVADRVEAGRTVIPVGFSQGGLMVTQLLRHAPDRFPAGAVLSGFVSADDQPADERLKTLHRPVFFGYGDADPIIAADRFAQSSAVLSALVDLEEHLYPGLSHAVSAQELDDLRAFLDRVSRA